MKLIQRKEKSFLFLRTNIILNIFIFIIFNIKNSKSVENDCKCIYNETDKICKFQPDDTTASTDYCSEKCGQKKINMIRINGMQYGLCVENCSYNYYDKETNICRKKCDPSSDSFVNKISTNNSCTERCEENQFLFKRNENINGGIIERNYCLDKCPDSAPYFYKKNAFEINKETECITKCKDGDFFDPVSHECLESCEDHMILIDSDSKNFLCDVNNNYTNCSEQYKYKYGEFYCLKHCSQTVLINKLNNVVTYILNNGTHEICSEDCKDETNRQFYKDELTLKCYENCSLTLNKYSLAGKCVETCREPYHFSTDNKCVAQCDTENNYYLYRKDNTCYKYCLKEGGETLYIDENSQECVSTCRKPSNSDPQYGEGYILEKKNNEQETVFYCKQSNKEIIINEDGTSTITTIKYYYHNNDDNILLNNSDIDSFLCKNNNESQYIYQIANSTTQNSDETGNEVPNDYICYKSCKEVPDNYIYQHGNKCHKTISDEFKDKIFYFQQETGIYKYLDSSEQNENDFCSKAGFYYKRGQQCIKECNTGEYQIPFKKDSNGNIEKLGECLTRCEDKKNAAGSVAYPYYTNDEKICREKCIYPFKRINNDLDLTDEITDETDNIGPDGSTCVMECPSDYYESFDGTVCYKGKCPDPNKFYIIKNNIKKCVEGNCKSISKYYFNGNYECIDECKTTLGGQTTFYYYNDEENQCLTSCNVETITGTDGQEKVNDKKFALKAEYNHEVCREECQGLNKYYFENEKICMSNCTNGFIIDVENHRCNTSCGDKNFLINQNVCSNKCTKDQPFYISVQFGGISMNQCVSSCNSTFYYEKDLSTSDIPETEKPDYIAYECVPICPPNYFEYEHECVKVCPEGLYQENGKCVSKCAEGKLFEKNSDELDYICILECDQNGQNKYATSSGECKSTCPLGENFIGIGNKCKNACDPLIDGEYYKLKESTNDYNIYECMHGCELEVTGETPNTKYIYNVEGTKECVIKCPEHKPYASDEEKKCYSICLKSSVSPFTIKQVPDGTDSVNEVKKCSISCDDGTGKNLYYENDKVCIDECKVYVNDKDNSCVTKCDGIEYKFLVEVVENGKNVKKCKRQCEGDNKYYSTTDYICGSECKYPNEFLLSTITNICADKCPEGQFGNPNTDTSIKSNYTCESGCRPGTYYYEYERKCLSSCNSTDYVIQGTQKCIDSCDRIVPKDNYHFYENNSSASTTTAFTVNTCLTECPTDKPFIDYNNHCSEHCSGNYQYYKPTDKICLFECPEGTKINENECLEKCPSNKFEDETNTCVDSCSKSKAGYIYYYDSDRICIKECKEEDYIYKVGDAYMCVPTCHLKDGKETYLDGKECVASCPAIKKFVIANYEHGELNQIKKCMTDCNQDYPFYKEEDNLNKCYGSCSGYYITNKDSSVISKKCVDECSDPYPYTILYNNTHKECLTTCPEYYYNKTCYKNCPVNAPYHEKQSFECLTTCPSGFADYKTKECMFNCEMNQKWVEESSNSEAIKLCLDSCSLLNYNTFETTEGQCVTSCNTTHNFRGENGTCVCQNLFYYDEEGKLNCAPPEKKSCEEIDGYKIQINETNQCINYCYGALTPNEKICIMEKDEKLQCPPDSSLQIVEGVLKCDCDYNYYVDTTKGKVCLGKDEECPELRYLNTETKECVTECGSEKIKFDKKCLDSCPPPMLKEGDTCKCDSRWYKTPNNQYVCLEEEACNDEYPFYIEETKQCVKNCNSDYPIQQGKNCFSSCPNSYIAKTINGTKNCICKYNWYYSNDQKIICKEENDGKSCEDIGKETNMQIKYLIKEHNQCVNSCPEEYQYHFNLECYKSCEEDDLEPSSTDSFECQCKGKWRVKNGTEIECISGEDCNDDEYLLGDQCIPNIKCPENTYLFNKTCIKECTGDLATDIMKGNECKCKNLWFERDDGTIVCLRENQCKFPEYPYLKNDTRECVKKETDCANYTIFNYVCYKFDCPKNTIKNSSEENICMCDPDKGFWNIFVDSDGKKLLNCGTDCPEEKKYHNETNQCVASCQEIGAKEYLGVCYNECPSLTSPNDNNICALSAEFEEKNLTDLVKELRTEIKTIYDNLPIGGLVINNENNATIQIYGLNRENNKKDSVIRANLAYLDLSACIEKIYRSNEMDDDAEIIVVKLDINSQNKSLVVNPIEYEFVNSKTAEVLDASVCERSEVVVSYPITYILKNKNKLRNLDIEENEEEKEIMDKFNRGKELYDKDNSVDSFNYNSEIYTDICYPIEVDGKDMILENRITYFYPNYSFCESSCNYYKTDFAGERIYCNCSIKNGIDLNRPHTVKLAQYNQNKTDNNQIGPTNIPVLKCISKAKIGSNGAFYFCIILILVEIGLLLAFIFQGLSSLTKKIRSKVFKDELNDSGDEDEKIEENKEKKLSKYTTSKTNENFKTEKTSKDLSSPPKKNNNEENKENEVINIKKHKNKKGNQEKRIDEKNNFGIFSDQNQDNNTEDIEFKKYIQKQGIDAPMAFYHSIRKEEKLLREKYAVSKLEDKFDSVTVVLTSIFDKIYFIRILLLSGKYEIISIMFSLYLLCHLILLTFSGFFFDIKTIRKIWEEDDYPDINYYLGYGFVSNLIVWVIFRIFCSLLENNNKVKLFMKEQKRLNRIRKEKKYQKLMSGIKRNIIIYLIIQFCLIMFCSFYLITFCGIYLGTKTKVFQAYGIAFIEIIIIKIIYGAILGILRKISLYAEKTILYNVVLIFNKYIS